MWNVSKRSFAESVNTTCACFGHEVLSGDRPPPESVAKTEHACFARANQDAISSSLGRRIPTMVRRSSWSIPRSTLAVAISEVIGSANRIEESRNLSKHCEVVSIAGSTIAFPSSEAFPTNVLCSLLATSCPETRIRTLLEELSFPSK